MYSKTISLLICTKNKKFPHITIIPEVSPEYDKNVYTFYK